MKKYSSSSSLLSASVNYPIHNQYIKYQKNDNHNTSYTNYSSKPNIPQKIINKKPKFNEQNITHQARKKPQDYQVLKQKINSLEERLGNIRKNYDILHNNRLKKSVKETNKYQSQGNVLTQIAICKNKNSKKNRYDVQSPKHSFEVSKNFIRQKKEKKKLSNLSKRSSVDEDQENIADYITKYDSRQSTAIHCISTSNLLKSVQAKQDYSKHIYYISNILGAFNTNKPSTFHQLCRNHLISSIDFINFVEKSNIKQNIPMPIPIKLPYPSRQTLIFDLDETLIHCNESLSLPHDVALSIKFPDKNQVKVGVNIRPYVTQCLKQLRKYFQLIVFTASHSCYANVIINHLDPQGELFSFRFFRQHCHKTKQGFYVKDLRIIDRDLSKVLLIDNAAYSYCFQPQNGVPIVPFYDSKADFQLRSLCSYLKSFYGLGDIRKRNDQCMKLSQYKKFANATSLISSLYQ